MFGDKLKLARVAKRLSQRELAELLHVSQQTVGSWEVNRSSPSPEMIKKISSTLEVSVSTLLGQEELETKKDPSTPEEAERVQKFEELFANLSEQQQKNALDYMRFLLSNREL